ncbi:P-loop containing nucleoside triphosphate hydrolase protein [Cystobasidium minutum MCA 4210]|uniref:P-loop containing nucleoside triphosphate hydrolase protein n=1 Tax=Cystobasidium minutum MCA 4210 TaxID=1397322 RepID=UPI0034D0080C|eukprot:jgi/Rhomi1/207417/estExt_Genemark1.C_1_t10314
MDRVDEAQSVGALSEIRPTRREALLLILKNPSLAGSLLLRSLLKFISALLEKTALRSRWNNDDAGSADATAFKPFGLFNILHLEYLPLWSLLMPLLSSIWPIWRYVDPLSFLSRQLYVDSLYGQHTQSHRWLSALLEDTLLTKASRNVIVSDFPPHRTIEKKPRQRPQFVIDPSDPTKLVLAEHVFPVFFRPIDTRVFWYWKYGTLFRIQKIGEPAYRSIRSVNEYGEEGRRLERIEPVIAIRSFSRSRKPLIKFLQDARDHHNIGVGQVPLVEIYAWGRVEMKAALLEDAAQFFNAREWYRRRGLTWKRGWVLYGPPGCGKTSVISALATTFDLPVYSLAVGSLKDTDLADAMAEVGSKCILVLEDIHALFPSNRANARHLAPFDSGRYGLTSGTDSTATMSTLLNMLDGLDSGEARITIATSNVSPNRIFGDALCRPGRFDRFFEFKNATREQARELFLTFYDDREWFDEGQAGKQTQAELAGDILRIANEWAAMVKDGQFSVAALQGRSGSSAVGGKADLW